MNCEIGLHLDFDVDENGAPSGCPGLEHFASDVNIGNSCQIVYSKTPGSRVRGETRLCRTCWISTSI